MRDSGIYPCMPSYKAARDVLQWDRENSPSSGTMRNEKLLEKWTAKRTAALKRIAKRYSLTPCEVQLAIDSMVAPDYLEVLTGRTKPSMPNLGFFESPIPEQVGIFGQAVTLPTRVEQVPLVFEIERQSFDRPAGGDANDQRIAAQYDPAATAEIDWKGAAA